MAYFENYVPTTGQLMILPSEANYTGGPDPFFERQAYLPAGAGPADPMQHFVASSRTNRSNFNTGDPFRASHFNATLLQGHNYSETPRPQPDSRAIVTETLQNPLSGNLLSPVQTDNRDVRYNQGTIDENRQRLNFLDAAGWFPSGYNIDSVLTSAPIPNQRAPGTIPVSLDNPPSNNFGYRLAGSNIPQTAIQSNFSGSRSHLSQARTGYMQVQNVDEGDGSRLRSAMPGHLAVNAQQQSTFANTNKYRSKMVPVGHISSMPQNRSGFAPQKNNQTYEKWRPMPTHHGPPTPTPTTGNKNTALPQADIFSGFQPHLTPAAPNGQRAGFQNRSHMTDYEVSNYAFTDTNAAPGTPQSNIAVPTSAQFYSQAIAPPAPWQPNYPHKDVIYPYRNYNDVTGAPLPSYGGVYADNTGRQMTGLAFDPNLIEIDPQLDTLPENHPVKMRAKHDYAVRVKNKVYPQTAAQNARKTIVSDTIIWRDLPWDQAGA